MDTLEDGLFDEFQDELLNDTQNIEEQSVSNDKLSKPKPSASEPSINSKNKKRKKPKSKFVIENKRYSCQDCGKTYSRSDALNVHMRSHTGERPYPCNYCDKRFYSSSDAKKHERTHTGESPFVCDLCEKAFKERATMRKHKLTHSTEKPFKCDFCDRWFSRSEAVTKHINNKHNKDRIYSCEECGVKLATNVTKENHLEGTNRTYSCEQRRFVCDQYYELRNASNRKMDFYLKLSENFSAKYPASKVPQRSTVDRIVATFEKKVGGPKSFANGKRIEKIKKSGQKKKRATAKVFPQTNMKEFQSSCAQQITKLTAKKQTDLQKSQIISEYYQSYVKKHKQEMLPFETKSIQTLFEKGVNEMVDHLLKASEKMIETKIEVDDDTIDPESESLNANIKEEIDIKEEGVEDDVEDDVSAHQEPQNFKIKQENDINSEVRDQVFISFKIREENDMDLHEDSSQGEDDPQSLSPCKIVNTYSISESDFMNESLIKTKQVESIEITPIEIGLSESSKQSSGNFLNSEDGEEVKNVCSVNISGCNGNTSQHFNETPAQNIGVIRANSIKKSVIVKNEIGRPLYVKNVIR